MFFATSLGATQSKSWEIDNLIPRWFVIFCISLKQQRRVDLTSLVSTCQRNSSVYRAAGFFEEVPLFPDHRFLSRRLDQGSSWLFLFLGLNFQILFNKVISKCSKIFRKQIFVLMKMQSLGLELSHDNVFIIILVLLVYIELRLYLTKENLVSWQYV